MFLLLVARGKKRVLGDFTKIAKAIFYILNVILTADGNVVRPVHLRVEERSAVAVVVQRGVLGLVAHAARGYERDTRLFRPNTT